MSLYYAGYSFKTKFTKRWGFDLSAVAGCDLVVSVRPGIERDRIVSALHVLADKISRFHDPNELRAPATDTDAPRPTRRRGSTAAAVG